MEASGVIAERLLGMRLVGMRFLVLVAACLIPTIKGDGQYFRVRPSNSSVLEGGEVTISCEVGNRVGTVQWVKDGFAYVIQQNGEIVGHPRLKLIGDQNAGIFNLKITDASLTDDGEYECQVGRYLRVKPIRASAHLIVTSPPQKVAISNHPKKQVIEVKVGESRRLECIVSAAKPAASIIWYRGNTQIKGGDTTIAAISIQGDKEKPGETKELLKYDTHGSITIMPTADDNGMDYTCEASHPAIPIDRPMRATITLSVFYPPGPPYIEGYTEGETVQRGQNVELACRSRGGNPQAEIVWYRNDEKVTAAHRRGPGVSENVYSFIARAEDDKARYRCEVSNIMSVQPMKVHVDLTVLFAPAGVTITGPTEAKADDQVLITCTTENSNPPADIKWTVDGHNFESNASKTELAPNGGWITSSNVTFSINRKSRSIVVICHASNAKLTENVVGTHTINVIYPPSKLTVTGYEEGTTIVAGTVLKLMCTATAGNPLATLTWYKNDRKVLGTVRQRNHAVSSELAILVNASDNNAHVRCEATNSATEIPLLNVLVLKVYFPPERVKINREPQDFHAGQEGRLICESSSSNPAAEMSWWKNGIPVPGTRNSTKPGLHGGYLSSVELTLDLTEDMNGEVYTCEAKNAELGRSSHDATTLDVLYKPIFSPLDPYELTGLEGEPFVISVSARGNPNTTEYTWTRDGLPLGSSGKRITAHGSTLNITRLDRHDAGTYICEALNKEGTTFYQLNLTVQYPAKIKRTSSSGIVYPPGIEAKLFCEVDGSPIGDEYVTWQKIGSNPELPGRYSTSFINRTSYLHIENPSQEDVGEYRCKVNNGIGNITSDPILFITNFKPEMTNTPLTRKAAANKGINVQLFCKARGSPLPHFTWIFNGKTLLPNATEDKYSITHSDLSELYSETTLTIYKVRSQDYGKYECLAQNKMGHSTENILLDVTSPPDKPSDLEVYNYTHDSVTLIWKRGFDGGLPTSHQIRWRQALDYDDRYHYLDVVPGEYKATISGLSLGTYYVFSVKAINEKGDSGFLPDLVKVQTLREAPPTESTSSENSSSYIIVIIITVSASACLLIAATIVFATIKSKKKVQRTGINKSQTADMYAPSTVNGDTMTGELSSMSDEKSDVNFDANDYVDEGRKTAASTYLIDQTMQDFGKGGLEMQVHQGTLGRRSNHMQTSMNMDSPPQRTTASGTLSGTLSKSSYIGNPSPAPPNDVSFYSVEMDNGGRGYIGYDGNPSPAPPAIDPTGGPYYPSSMGSTGHIMGGHMTGASTGTLTRTRTLPRPVPPPDVTVMTAGTKSPIPPSVPPPPATFARAGTNNGGPHSHPHLHPPPPSCQSHPLSTFAATPSYSDIDGHLV
ncbi:PREDICTED: nephrin-like isoform X4 [Trachymyrmex septentrionalis]|uniref:nephrin-like isoform X4 n=1 Tax=Trachymyrmex septentrionalis TaxID=34720 RepID=UPI00084ED549|nr:PREDICTED: nephrin-like isoform X4 [Trachymyrmex septentrionalis]